MTREPLAAALLLALGACRQQADPSLIVASGHVEAEEVRVATKVAGRLEALAVAEGDRVSAGQELARLETTDLRLHLAQALAERDQASAELALRLAGAREEEIAEAAARAASGRAELEAAERDLERMQALLDRGSGTPKARDDARTRRDVDAARLAALEQTLARLRAGFRREEKDAARGLLAAREARVAQLQQQLEDATIESPVGGVVTHKLAARGELLSAGAPICVVSDLAGAWLTIYVAEPDLGRVRLGGEAEVVTDAGQARKGRLTFISPEAEFTPKNVQTRDERVKLVYRAKVGLDNADGLFKPGMPAEARLRAEGGGQAEAAR
jgi:HlyD family secretion protein